MAIGTAAVVLVDGDCGLCGRAARFLVRRLPADADAEVLALQSERGRAMLATVPGLEQRDALVFIRGDHVTQGGAAVADALLLLPRWALMGRLVHALPAGPREWGYDLVARHRGRLAPSRAVCALEAQATHAAR